MSYEHRETASPPQVTADSLPATPSDVLPPPPLAQTVQYRYPVPGYWPMLYDMRMWAGLQMQQYMMDRHHQSEHGHGKYCDHVVKTWPQTLVSM